MAIFSIEPKTSKITGGVTIDISGNSFLSTPFSIIPSISGVVDKSTTLASIEDSADGLLLNVQESTNQRAAFQLDRIFPEAYKLISDISLMPLSMPLIKNTILVGYEVINSSNLTERVRFFISYNQFSGYKLVIEKKSGTSTLYRDECNIDPNEITQIGINNCGKYIHGFIKVNNQEVYCSKSQAINFTESFVQIFSETPETGVALNSQVLIKKVYAETAISFIGYPTNLISLSATAIRIKTLSGEISAGDLIVAKSDLTIQKKTNEVKYVYGSGISNVAKQFDSIQAIYAQHVTPSREDLFKNQDGFQWDEDYLLTDSSRNKELAVPSLWDPTTGNIPKTFFQSGVGPFSALQVKSIEKVIAEDIEKWYPLINHGTYYVENVPYYLFSDQSIIEYLGEKKTTDGRSIHNLLYPPKIGVPISVFSLTEDKETKITLQRKKLLKKGKFTGKVINGTELDTKNNPINIDDSKDEFVVTINNNNQIINWIIPIAEVPAIGIYSFSLPKVPLEEFNTIFSRTDIFKVRKIKAKKYGEATYGTLLFGEGIENYGDYTIDYQTGEVEIKLEYLYNDLGVTSFTFDYPATIEFNKDFTSDKGSRITNPKFSDLNTLDRIGVSSGRPNQEFRLYDFPIIDYSTNVLVDIQNFQLFIYDEFDNSFDQEWTRVLDLLDHGAQDKVYALNAENGIVRFGNGVHGKIPGKYLNILGGYKPTMKIQYEPESSNDYWIAKTTDLNLTKQNLGSGFLYLNRKKLIPSQLVSEFASKKISVFETTEIGATVYTQDGEIIPNAKVSFEMLNGGGKFRDLELVTNPNGYVSTIYTPSSKLEDMGIKVDLFKQGSNASSLGDPIFTSYGSKGGVPYLSLKSNETIQGNLDEILVFKILDDGDNFLPYNNATRTGGRLVLYYKSIPTPTPVKGEYLAGSIIGFADQLPQPFDEYAPNYEPNLRGFYIVAKKTIEARAYVEVDGNRVYSNIVSLICEYSSIQTGVWTLPTPPLSYEHSQINTATYLDINV